MSETRLTYRPIIAPDAMSLNSQLFTISLGEINFLHERIVELESTISSHRAELAIYRANDKSGVYAKRSREDD